MINPKLRDNSYNKKVDAIQRIYDRLDDLQNCQDFEDCWSIADSIQLHELVELSELLGVRLNDWG